MKNNEGDALALNNEQKEDETIRELKEFREKAKKREWSGTYGKRRKRRAIQKEQEMKRMQEEMSRLVSQQIYGRSNTKSASSARKTIKNRAPKTCPKGHVFLLSKRGGIPRKYIDQGWHSVTCDSCDRGSINRDKWGYFHCGKCSFDQCLDCGMKKPKPEVKPPKPVPTFTGSILII